MHPQSSSRFNRPAVYSCMQSVQYTHTHTHKFGAKMVSRVQRPLCGLLLILATLLAVLLQAIAQATDNDNPNLDSHTRLKYAHFYQWFASHGGVATHVGVDNFGDMGLGIVAKGSSVHSGEEILKIPLSICFSQVSLARSKDSVHKQLSSILGSGTGSSEELVLFGVLMEKLRGRDSSFDPYIQMLPEYVPSLVHFSEDELKMLQDDRLMGNALQHQHNKKKLMEKSLEKLRSEGFPADLLKRVNLENYLWAGSIVDSRGLRFSGNVYLAPFADFFNYKPHPELRKSNAGQFYLDHHKLKIGGGKDKDVGTLIVTADRDYLSVGEQVFEDYGDNDDNIYITYHGFIPDHNPFRCYLIHGVSFDTLPQRTQQFILDLGFTSHMAPYSCINPRVSSGELMTIEKGLEVYTTAISMSTEQVDACTLVISRLMKDKLPISRVYMECDIGGQFQRAMKLLSTSQSSGSSIEVLKEAAGGKDTTVWRIIANLQESINNSSSPRWTTSSTVHDKAELASVSAELGAASKHKQQQGDNNKSLLHQLLALRYRIAMKECYHQVKKYFLIGTEGDNSDMHSDRKSAKHEVIDHKPEKIAVEVGVSGSTETVSHPSHAGRDEDDDEETRQLRLDVTEFNTWFQNAITDAGANTGAVNAVEAAVIPGFRIGTLASRDISAEEIYLGVPPEIVMDADKAYSDTKGGVGTMVQSLQRKYRNRDSFHELLFYLLSEKFLKGSSSAFAPYLKLLPTPQQLDIPLLWSDDVIAERLAPSTHLIHSALAYKRKVRKMFDFVAEIEDITDFFADDDSNDESVWNWENYVWANAILDSRSIWWGGQRHLVPMLDFVNCKEGVTNPQRVHATTVNNNDVAITKSPWAFGNGEQVFENYGQPNHIYFLHHGFALEGNTHDCLYFEMQMTEEQLDQLANRTTAAVLAEVRPDVN
jgi:hypothetical protein